MKITRLKISQIKGVRQVEITEPGDVVEVAGANGAGKSSVLDSIAFALGGKRAIDRKPLRNGEEKGEIVLETESLEVIRKFKEDGSTTLTVKSKDGGKYGQEKLGELFNSFTFDPLAFSRKSAEEQIKTIQELAGKEFCATLEYLDAQFAEIYQQRKEINGELSRMGNIAEVVAAESVDLSALTAELQAINAFNRDQQTKTRTIEELRLEHNRVVREIDRLEVDLKIQKSALAAIEENMTACPKPEPEKSTDELNAKLVSAGEINRRAEEYREYLRKLEEHRGKTKMVNDYTSALDKLKEEREVFSKKAQLPVEGVVFSSTGIRVGGIPFEQLSSSEKIRVSARIGMSMNPELRIMFVKDGSLLDQNSYCELILLAKERDYQIWMETVGEGHGDAYILEAGEIKTMPAPQKHSDSSSPYVSPF